MCGLTGLLVRPGRPAAELEELVVRMSERIAHRGPDDWGTWVDAEAGVALGFRRLSIVDLSQLGHQPMRSASGRFWMAFNGEVYNHAELRAELVKAGCTFRGHSDSEVMLAAFERWGTVPAISRFVGMFAIALWDTANRTLTLIRDRLGKKPLFVYQEPGLVSFGSELKALLAGPSFDREIDRDAVVSYLRYLYVPAPRTIYRRARKLLPGHLLTIADPAAPLPESVCYWDLADVARAGGDHPFEGSEQEAVDELDRLLCDAVGLRMQADVPVGALLSGGIDSSVVVAMMQALSSRKVRTYTVGFREREHDESEPAREVARYLGTEHTELTLHADDALALVPRLPTMFDEPLADPSQLPTFLVCQLARRDVTVALTGDGGDEVFAGYNRYVHGARLLPRLSAMPRPARAAFGAGLGVFESGSWDAMHRAMSAVLPAARRQRLVGLKVAKLRRLLSQETQAAMYRTLMSAWHDPAALVPGGHDEAGPFAEGVAAERPRGLVDRMALADQASYLPDDLLAKVDRASMAVSLEVRVPILDHRIVEFGWRLPLRMRIRQGRGKWILREVLHRRVPRALVDRPKIGFSVPIAAWLRGPLKSWGTELLDPDRLRRGGLLDPEGVGRAWTNFQGNGAADEAPGLWAVLMLLAWQEHWGTA
jgi:asparagine synthase (glutamine-hydrolysing)